MAVTERYVTDLLHKIRTGFGEGSYFVEVSVLDGNGDSFDFFSGLARDMAPSHLSKVFRDISCFYMFTVLGIEENLLSELDQHQSSMRRMEFCWLIDVQPPRLEGASATGAVLSWREVKFCGFHLPESFIQEAGMGVMYELEISEAHAYRTGIGSKFASDASASDYLVVCSRSQAGSVAVVDLEPATWYHARIAVAYNGTRFYSLPQSFYTEFSVPPPPARPRLQVLPEMSVVNPNEERTPCTLLSWSLPTGFGLTVRLSEVQFQEVMRADRWDSSKPMTSPLYIKRHPNSKIAKFLDAELEAQQAVPAAETTPVFGPPYGHAARQKFAFETETKKTARAKSQQSRMRYKTAAVELPTHGSRILHSSESSRFDSRKPRAGNSSPEPVRVQATEEECTNLSGFSSSEAKIEALPLDEAVLDPEPDYGHLTRSDGDTVLCGPWTTIYRNSHNKLKLKVPDPGVVEWRFRLRVSNKSSEGGGWSPWGPPLYAHALSHPDLFDSQTTSLSTVLSVGGGSASPQNASIHKTHPLNVAHKYHPQSHVSCAPSLSTPLDAPSSDREAPRDVFFIEGYQSLHNDLNGTVLAPPAAAEAIVGEDHRAYSERSTVTSDSNARIANALPAEGGAIPSPPVGDGSRQTHSADASVRSSRSDSRSRSLNRDTAVGETGEYSGAGGTHDARRQSAKT